MQNQNREHICLVKEGLGIDPSLKVEKVSEEAIEQFLKEVEDRLPDFDSMQLNSNSKDVSDNVAGYIARASEKLLQNCCEESLKSEESSPPGSYISILSRGGLITPCEPISNAVSRAFVILDATSDDIRRSKMPSKRAGLEILKEHLDTGGIVCDAHSSQF